MSNFQTFGAVTEGLEGSAPARFIASTVDNLAAMLVPGYLNDKSKIVKANDIIDVCYADTSTFPLNTGEAALFASFAVQYDPTLGNWNMILKTSSITGIAAYGVHSATYSNAGGSATTTVNDSSITINSIVLARWKSSANPVVVQTVAPGNGSFVVVSSGNPGASVLEYISILPSVALQNAGAIAAQYSYAGGATTITIANPLITAGMVVNANFVSQTNAAKIDTVIATAGVITIVVNTNPGISVIAYSAVLPSSPLTTLGLYGATYANAGGSATTTITDANITASSIVVADWASQANAVQIEKVTPSASTLTILSSGDPGASVLNYVATPLVEGVLAGTYLVAANNLSDVASASASLANLGGLPLAGGQMTGAAYLTKGTATFSSNVATLNTQSGILTTASLSTASGASNVAQVLSNSLVTASSVCVCSLAGGTNTTLGVSISAVCTSGTITFSIFNNGIAAAALNGTVQIAFAIF